MPSQKKPWKLTTEEREQHRIPNGYEPEVTEEELIDLSTWKADIEDFEYNIKTLTTEKFRSMIERNITPYYTDGYWIANRSRCEACGIWNSMCHCCPVYYWCVIDQGMRYTLCKHLMIDYTYSEWDKVGLRHVVDKLLEFYSDEKNIKSYQKWALKQIKTRVEELDNP